MLLEKEIKEYAAARKELDRLDDILLAKVAPIMDTMVKATDKHGLYELVSDLPRGFTGKRFIYEALLELEEAETA